MANLRYFELKTPLTVQLELTSQCTNQCVYCYNFWNYNSSVGGTQLSLDGFMAIGKRLAEGEIFEVVLTGGGLVRNRIQVVLTYPNI